jgi:hypothetical protein
VNGFLWASVRRAGAEITWQARAEPGPEGAFWVGRDAGTRASGAILRNGDLSRWIPEPCGVYLEFMLRRFKDRNHSTVPARYSQSSWTFAETRFDEIRKWQLTNTQYAFQ